LEPRPGTGDFAAETSISKNKRIVWWTRNRLRFILLVIKRQKNPESKEPARLAETFDGKRPTVFFSRPNERSGAFARWRLPEFNRILENGRKTWMSIYISKNNQQTGPFDESKVLEMLDNGQLSPDDFAVRQGGSQWQKLGEMFPNAGRQPPQTPPPFGQPVNQPSPVGNQPQAAQAANQPAVAPAKPKKSRKGLLFGCLGILLFSGLVLAVLGFLGYRNMYPAESKENLPDKVKDFTLDTRYPPKGNIWGSETNYVGLYKKGTESVLYMMTVYGSESAAKDAFRSDLVKSCKTGESPMYFSFMKNGAEVSQGATCAAPLYVQKDNKLVAIGGSGGGADTFIEFAENLPFNDGAEMKKK
jgi:hypothetical protein